MQIEIKLDPHCREPKLIVVTDKVTEEINTLIKNLSRESPPFLAGFQGDVLELLNQSDIIRIYASGGKVLAVTDRGEYVLRLRLYELEERLDKKEFIRISNSEIINLKKAGKFDLNFSGTICVSFQDGSTAYVSRRYIGKIKKILGI